MVQHIQRIGVVAPAGRLEEAVAERVAQIALERFRNSVALEFHPQCFKRAGHFAGTDAERSSALVEFANNCDLNAIWFARGGYGSIRIVDSVLSQLGPAARLKTYLGYSDLGSLLGALYANGFTRVAHGPMPADISREGGDVSVVRALEYLSSGASSTIEPNVQTGEKAVAFNLTILSRLIGTPYFPELTGHVVLLEEVSEYMYSIDRTLAHLTSYPPFRKIAGLRLGRCSLIPPNEPEFGQSALEVVQHWCKKSGIRFLGLADIGHDVDNKIVPFGADLVS